MIVAAHQPNWLPGESVISKLEQADTVLWLDEAQFSKGGWTNRNRMPDGSWLTVPVRRVTDGQPINRVRLADGKWRERHIRTLRQSYGSGELVERVCAEIARPYRMLVGLNVAILRLLLPDSATVFQSHLDGGRPVLAVSEQVRELLPVSQRLAMMVEEVGGGTYLSGPSGFRYLDEWPFHKRGIKVEYFSYLNPTNPCVLERLRVRG